MSLPQGASTRDLAAPTGCKAMSDQILDVPLTVIEAPDAWNARSGAWTEDPADPTSDDGGYEGLKASMQSAGRNDEPVLLRPWSSTVPYPPHPFKYIVVDGFRRYRVAKELEWPSLRAVVENLTDFEARRRNLQAQTGRIRHKPADLAWGIADLKRLGGPKLTHDDIASNIGVSSQYVGTLLRIMTDVDPKVTSAWRASTVRVNVQDLQRLTALPKEKHWAEWETLVMNVQTRPSGASKFSGLVRLERAAKELGRTIGALQRLDVVYTAAHGRLTPALAMITKKELTPEQIAKLEIIMGDGFSEGLAGKEGT